MKEIKLTMEIDGKFYGSTYRFSETASMLANETDISFLAKSAKSSLELFSLKVQREILEQKNGNFFYEVIKTGGRTELVGPLENIFEATPDSEYAFVQMFDGKPVVGFKREEILVSDRLL